MNIIINNKSYDKTDLLIRINASKLSAIVFIRGQANIRLKDAKDIVENLATNPDFYDNTPVQITERDSINEQEQVVISTSTQKKEQAQTQKTGRKGTHIIQPNNTRKYIIIGTAVLVSLLLYSLLE